jgi:hypothetical protein
MQHTHIEILNQVPKLVLPRFSIHVILINYTHITKIAFVMSILVKCNLH